MRPETRIVDEPNEFVIDGLNVCRWPRLKTSLPVLLTLIREIAKRTAAYSCVFDAVTPHRLRKEDIDTYHRLFSLFPDSFTEVTGGIEADDIILSIAQQHNSSVISNDRFRKKKYIDRHPWLETQPHRLIKGCVAKGSLIVADLSIHVDITGDPASLLDDIKRELERGSNPTQPLVASTKVTFFPATEDPQRVKPLADITSQHDDEITLVRPSGNQQGIAKPGGHLEPSDQAKRERILRDIENFRAEDARRRRAEKRIAK